jgi:hypothetical protein
MKYLFELPELVSLTGQSLSESGSQGISPCSCVDGGDCTSGGGDGCKNGGGCITGSHCNSGC